MALMKCPECGNKVSSNATGCPHCGFPISTLVATPPLLAFPDEARTAAAPKGKRNWGCIGCLGLLGLFATAILISGFREGEERRRRIESMTPEQREENYKRESEQQRTEEKQKAWQRTQREEKDRKLEAFQMSEPFIREQLRSPRTAKFPREAEKVVSLGNSSYRVYAYVDSENAFGALLRGDYECKMTYADGRWTCSEIKITSR